MNDITATFTIERSFDAPPATVLAAWTRPDLLGRWFCPPGWTTPADRMALDVQPGGRWTVTMVAPDGAEAVLDGVYREIDPPQEHADETREGWDIFFDQLADELSNLEVTR